VIKLAIATRPRVSLELTPRARLDLLAQIKQADARCKYERPFELEFIAVCTLRALQPAL